MPMSTTAIPVFADFVEPPWRAPLDGSAALEAVPDDATIAGMFLAPMAEGARAAGAPLPSARDRYTGFSFYPLREHVALLIESSQLMFPDLPLRMGLRKLGRVAPGVMLKSTLGKVTMGSAEGVTMVLSEMSKIFAHYLRPSHAEVICSDANNVVVRLRDIHYFIDSHFIGIYEGGMGCAGVKGEVRILEYGPTEADLLCSW